MKSISLILSVFSSVAMAQSFDSLATPSTREMVEQASHPHVGGVDVQAIVREVSRQQQMQVPMAIHNTGSDADQVKLQPRKNFDIVLAPMESWDEHSVEELALALRAAGLREEDALTVHMHQEISEAKANMAKNRFRKALKIALQKPINDLRNEWGDNQEQGGGIVAENDEKGFSIADRLTDSVRFDGDKIRFKLYSRSAIESNRSVSVVRKVGEKTYMEVRLNKNINERLYYGYGANIGQRTDQGQKNSSFVFYVSAKLDPFFRLVK